MLRRKPAFRRLTVPVATAYPVVVHFDRHPEYDYCPVPTKTCIKPTPGAWVGVRRIPKFRKLAVIQEVKNADLTNLSCLSQIAAPNISRIVALYLHRDIFFAVHEHVDLDIEEIAPLCDKEIANAFAQVRHSHQSIHVHVGL